MVLLSGLGGLLNLTTTTMAPITTTTTASPVATIISLAATISNIMPYTLKNTVAHDQIASRTTWDQQPFDFIVVGAGAAGAVVASRLTENPAVRVLVLEMGGAESSFTDTPAMDAVNTVLPTEASKYNTYMTEPQTGGGLGFPENKIGIVTGTVLGGGSTINGMMYNRGGAADFDGWAQDYGCTNWTYADVLPFFKKSENNVDPVLRSSPYHGTQGPLTVTTLDESEMDPRCRLVSDTLLDGYSQLGYHQTDFNGANPLGTTTAQRTVKNGKRQSTSTAFLEPVYKNRPNLQILTGAKVTKVNFDGKKATGVTFTWMFSEHTANVTREVILSAGAMETPKLLMLSGVGPAADLLALKIPLVADLPVGKNFQDHVRVGGVNFNVNQIDSSYWTELLDVVNWGKLATTGTGPLANDIYLHQPSFLNVRTSVPDRGLLYGPSDLFIAPAIFPVPIVGLSPIQHQIRPDLAAAYYAPNFLKPQLNLFLTLNYVVSRGFVKLRSSDPSDPPIVDPRYFTDENGDDMARCVESYKLARRLEDTPAFKKIGAVHFNTTLPNCQDYLPADSDEYIECVIRTLSSTELHPCCSARMAGESNPTAVVGPRLNVLGGIQGLRVADASVMPFAVTANLMAATIMIGEKGAHMILEDNGLLVQ